MDALDELIMAGPDARYTVKAIVLQRHGDIATARQLMRTWPVITEALGFRREQWKQVSACFRRVDAGVKAGKLKSQKTVAVQRPQSAKAVDTQLPAKRPLPGQIPVGDKEGIVDAVTEKLGANFFK